MSIAAPPLVMTIDDRQKCFEERKRLGNHPCSDNHYVTLGVEIDSGVLLTPESSPSALSSASYKEQLHRSTESLVQQQPPPPPPPPPVTRCSVLAMPAMLSNSPVTSEHDRQGGYMPGVSHAPIGSPPLQMGSPYSGCSSPPASNCYSPEHYEHQMPPHSQPMGSPAYHTPSPYQSNIHSPGQYAGNGSAPSPTYSNMDTVEGVPHLIPFSSAVTTCGTAAIPTVFAGEQAIYTVPHAHPQMVDTFSGNLPAHLPPFAHVFEGQLPHETQIQERHSSPESFCSDSAPVTIKQMPNEFGIGGIEFYHPPTPPNMVEGAPPTLIYPPEMCGHLPPEMCGSLPPLPNHLCPIPTLSNHSRRRPKQPRKVPNIEVDDSDIKDIPTSAQLWEFTLRVLKKPKYKYMVSWEKREEGLFRFNNAQAFAALWGKHRNRPQMSYDKVARALRYYYKRNILEQVGGRLTYRFTKRLSKLYLSDV